MRGKGRVFQFSPIRQIIAFRLVMEGSMADAMSLWVALSQVPDPREASGTRHPLEAI
jgi:hypothetical protein